MGTVLTCDTSVVVAALSAWHTDRAVARKHVATLLTLDRRAQRTYVAVGAAHTMLVSA